MGKDLIEKRHLGGLLRCRAVLVSQRGTGVVLVLAVLVDHCLDAMASCMKCAGRKLAVPSGACTGAPTSSLSRRFSCFLG